MISLQTLLAAESTQQQIPPILWIVVGVILAIAFIVGMIKGFYRVGKGGFYWALAGILFVLVYNMTAKNIPLSVLMQQGEKLIDISGFVWSAILVLACVIVTLIICGSLSVLFRPRINTKLIVTDVSGYQYEIEEEGRGNKRRWEVDYKPSAFGRLFGGLFSLINIAFILVVVGALAILVINGTILSRDMQPFLTSDLGKTLLEYSSTYALDFLTVGLVFSIAFKGYRKGFVGITRSLLRNLGLIAVIIIGFILPFFQQTESIYVVGRLVERCTALFAKMQDLPEQIFGRLMAGLVIATTGVIVVLLINFLLAKLTEAIEDTVVIRFLDGAFAVIIYLILGALLCLVLWSLLYTLDSCGVFKISDAFVSETPTLAKEFYHFAEGLLKDFVDTYFKGLMK